MTTELKAGYWKTPGGATVELIAERDGRWFGRIVGERVAPGNSWTTDDRDSPLYPITYLGPTLPPDPGPGWRLLRKGPVPEGLEIGDQQYDGNGGWIEWNKVHHYRYEQYDDRFYRRRVTPEPPQPPEGWELLPDGTEWQEGYKRFSTSKHSPYAWTDDNDAWCKCGQYEGFYVWYARRIEPEPFEGELGWFPCEMPRDDHPHHACTSDGQFYVQRQYHNGEWRDVGVQG